MLSRCSDTTRLRRFLGPRRSFPEPYLTEALAEHPEHFALVAATPAAVVALASCRAVAGEAAELAVLVEDAWQRHGIGTRLLNRLIEHADQSGLRTLKATVLTEQEWILRALRSYGTCTAPSSIGVFEVTVRREPHHAGLPWAARPAGPAGLREDDRAQPHLLLHIGCQADGQILPGLPTRYLCGAPVRLLLAAIAPGDGPDGPGVCPICAALDHPGRLPA